MLEKKWVSKEDAEKLFPRYSKTKEPCKISNSGLHKPEPKRMQLHDYLNKLFGLDK
jgi:hypothetical protein